MPAKTQNTLRTIGSQIHGSRNTWTPRLNSEERTELTWAKVIESYDNIPEIYKGFFGPFLSNGQTFPYTVFTPAFENLGYRITEKLVCAFEHEIYVLERSGKALETQCYPLAGVNYVEVRSILLDTRVKISGITRQGVPTAFIVRFSSATEHLFVPILKRIRLHAVASKEAVRNSELAKFDHWINLNYKFMNLARSSLAGGERVIQAILQPEIRKRMFRILSKTYYRTISPTHAILLTDRELITIKEEVLQGRKDKYGGLWNYIHLNKIAALSISREDGKLLTLSIQLLTGECFEYLFQASMKNEVDQLLDRFVVL